MKKWLLLLPWLLGPAMAGSVADFLLQLQDSPVTLPHPNTLHPGQPWLHVSVPAQTLAFYDERGLLKQQWIVSTAKNGVGEKVNSYQTPRGWHKICERIGDGIEPGTIIYRRKVTPWKYTAALHAEYPDKDWILTRIMWLCGQEPGKNQGGDVDSYDRAIYIHGAGAHVAFGTPTSLGCIRMRNEDIIDLYNTTENGLDVLISEQD